MTAVLLLSFVTIALVSRLAASILCGTGSPGTEHYAPERVPQAYATTVERELLSAGTVAYKNASVGAFTPLAELDLVGRTGHIRIVPVWDAITNGDAVGGIKRRS